MVGQVQAEASGVEHRLLFGRRLAQAAAPVGYQTTGSPITTRRNGTEGHRLMFGRRLTPDPSVRFAKHF